jgi:hypothetical protein
VLAVAGAALVAAPPAVAADSRLSGTVSAAGGAPLSGICVDVYPTDESDGAPSTTTDAQGRWSIGGLGAGEYLVSFNSCFEDRQSAYVPEWFDDAPSIDRATPVRLTGTSVRTGVDAVLEPTGAISGRVTDDDTSAGIEGVCVTVLAEEVDSFGEARTDATGAYRVDGLSPGEHLVFFADCAAPFTYPGELYDDVPLTGDETSTAEPDAVTVVSGQTTPDVDAGLLEGGAVAGTVTAAHTGRQVPLVCVGLHPADDPGSEAVNGTATGVEPGRSEGPVDGTYVVAGVTPGRYAVAFADPLCEDDGYRVSWYDGQQTQDRATPVEVSKGRTVGGIDGVVTPLPSTSFVCPGDADERPASFRDVPRDNVHRGSIACMDDYDILDGRADGTYGPAEAVRRGQLATLVVGLLDAAGVPLPADPPNAFDDDDGHVHEPSIDRVAALGLLGGKGERRFAPDETVERGQLATVLVTTYQQVTGFTLNRPASAFDDDGGSVHEANIDRASLAGLVAGTSATRYEPRGTVRRDALATFLARALDRTTRDTLSETPTGGELGPSRATAAARGAERVEAYRTLRARR